MPCTSITDTAPVGAKIVLTFAERYMAGLITNALYTVIQTAKQQIGDADMPLAD
jgi:hypothetical protein